MENIEKINEKMTFERELKYVRRNQMEMHNR